MKSNHLCMGLVLAAITSGLTLSPDAGATPLVLNEFKSASATVATAVTEGYWATAVAIPQFDPAKGQLVGVGITMSSQAYSELNFTPVDPYAWTYLGSRTVFKALNPADGTEMLTSEVTDFMHINADVDSHVAGGGNDESRTMLFSSTDKAAFQGTGSVNLQLEAWPLMYINGSAGAGSDLNTYSNVIVKVTYYYKGAFGLDP